jgi:hypothetical protein
LGDTDKALETIQTVFSMAQVADDPYNAGHAWRILGLIAARLDKALPSKAAEQITYDAPTCFANSLALFRDIKNGREQAMVLWEWAKYELAKGDKTKGKAMWQEAFGIFEKLNLSRFMASMEKFNRTSVQPNHVTI